MANFPGLQMTAAGRDLQAKAQTGVPLNFSRVAIGDGENPVDYEPLVNLVSEKKSLDLAGFELLGDGTSKLKVLLTNEGIVEGFFIREIGVFAVDPDTSTEILYSYSNADQYIDYLPAFGGATIVEMTFDLYTVVGNATTVTATINDYLVHATKADVDELRPYVLPVGGDVDHLLRKRSNLEGDTEWFNPADGIQFRINSVTEERIAIGGQDAFALTKTITNGLAVYVNGLRLSENQWSSAGGSQVLLDAALVEGDRVQFVNNEEVGLASLARVSLDGPDFVYQGTSNSYTITDFDRFSAYEVMTNVGSASHAGGIITLDIPSDAEALDGIMLTVQRNGGAMSFSIALGDQAVAQPQITSPLHMATDVEESPTIASSAFKTYPSGVDTQLSASWRIALDEAMTNIVWSSESNTSNKTSINVPEDTLLESTTYYVDVLHTGNVIGDSVRSTPISFTTKSSFYGYPTSVILQSFAAPNPNTQVLAFDGENLLSTWHDSSNYTIFVHDGISSTVKDTITMPFRDMNGMTVANGDLVVSSTEGDKFYIMNGLSGTIKRTIISPGANYASGLAFDGTYIYLIDNGVGYMYKFTASGNHVGSLQLSGISRVSRDNLVWDGRHLIVSGGGEFQMLNGFTKSIINTFPRPGGSVGGATFTGDNFVSMDLSANLIYVHGKE